MKFDVEEDHDLDRSLQLCALLVRHELRVDGATLGVDHLEDKGKHILFEVSATHATLHETALARDPFIFSLQTFHHLSLLIFPLTTFLLL